MEGFGVHTFRLVNAAGDWKFVKFHWRPILGLESTVWDEAVKIAVGTVLETLPRTPKITRVIFACFDDAMLTLYEAELARLQAPPSKPV